MSKRENRFKKIAQQDGGLMDVPDMSGPTTQRSPGKTALDSLRTTLMNWYHTLGNYKTRWVLQDELTNSYQDKIHQNLHELFQFNDQANRGETVEIQRPQQSDNIMDQSVQDVMNQIQQIRDLE